MEGALRDFGGNYTEEESRSLEEKLEAVKAALAAIGNAEKAAEEIGKLPSAEDAKLSDKSALDQVKNYVIEGFNLWGGGAAELYKDDKGESRLITTGDQANVSSQAASGNNLCPYRMTEKNNTMYNGYTWTPACYLYPIVFSDFMLSSPDGDVNNSPIYQNPGWPIEDGASALELPN